MRELNEDTKSIVCFKKVAERKHLTKAAQELYISQSQLSRVITSLEEMYGVPLFDRTGKGMQLTEYGRLYYDYVQRLLQMNGQLQKDLSTLRAKQESRMVITSNASAYMPLFLKFMIHEDKEFRFLHMSVKRNKCEQQLLQGMSDFSIACLPLENIGLNTMIVHREGTVVIYPEGHWLENHRTVSLMQLKNENFVGQAVGYATRDCHDILFKPYNFVPNYIIETSDSNLIPKCVSSGLGISIVPRSSYVHDSVFKHRYTELEEPIYADVGLSWNKERQLSEKDLRFIEKTKEFFKKISNE